MLPIRELVSSIFIYLPFTNMVKLRQTSKKTNYYITKHFTLNWSMYKDVYHQIHLYYLTLCNVYDVKTFAQLTNIHLKDLCLFACRYNRKDVLEVLLTEDSKLGTDDHLLVIATISAGHLSLLKWLNNSEKDGSGIFHQWTPEHINRAALYGYLDIVQYLRTPTKVGGMCHWTAETCEQAAKSGNLSLLRWMRHSKDFSGVCPWSVHTMRAAVSFGHLHIVKWLRNPALHTPYWKNTNLDCSFNGHNFALKWKSELSPCPWTNTEIKLTPNGDLVFLPKPKNFYDSKWTNQISSDSDFKIIPVSEFVCPWDEDCSMAAITSGHFNIFKWLIRSGCPWNKHKTVIFLTSHSKCTELMWLFKTHDFSCDFWPKIGKTQKVLEEKEDEQLDSYLFNKLTERKI